MENTFVCKACRCTLPEDYCLRTDGWCYLCDPNITLAECLSDEQITKYSNVSTDNLHELLHENKCFLISCRKEYVMLLKEIHRRKNKVDPERLITNPKRD